MAFSCSIIETIWLPSLPHRYTDIVPYDPTRVLLAQTSPDNYLNASWIREPSPSGTPTARITRTWIASQAPTRETTYDFLSMFMNTPKASSSSSSPAPTPRVILMLTACRESGREKSARYWPTDVGETIKVTHRRPVIVSPAASRYVRPEVEWQDGPEPPIEVTFVSSIASSKEDEKHQRGWRTNELLLTSQERKETIYQIEYLGWQDHGVPDSPAEVLRLLKHVNDLLDQTSEDGYPGSLVTHCSAGVGRTGSFIAIAWLAQIMQDLLKADQGSITALRKQAQQSPLGPLPTISAQTAISKAADKAKGLLPSFLHKDNKQANGYVNSHAIDSDFARDFDFVMAAIDNLRDQRTTMVQTPKQVEFVYEVAKTWWEENAT